MSYVYCGNNRLYGKLLDGTAVIGEPYQCLNLLSFK